MTILSKGAVKLATKLCRMCVVRGAL